MTSVDSLLIAGAVLVFVVWRQLQPRAIRTDRPYALMAVLAALGVADLVGFAGDHRVTAAAWTLLVVGLAAAAGFGVARGALVHVWRRDGVAMRQGNGVTVVLWVVALGVHLLLDLVIDGVDRSASGIGADSVLLSLAVALTAQRVVTRHRASLLGPT